MTINLTTPCFTVENGEIVEATLGDFSHFIETTTRPTGVGYKYYITTISRIVDAVYDDEENLIEDEHEDDVWVLACWMTWGGPQRVISEHASEEEALAAAERIYVHDILSNNEQVIHLDREGAERELANFMDDEA